MEQHEDEEEGDTSAKGGHSENQRLELESEHETYYVNLNNSSSKEDITDLKPNQSSPSDKPESNPTSSNLSLKSKDDIINFEPDQKSLLERLDRQDSEVSSSQSVQQHQTQLDSIFMLLEAHLVNFVKNELKHIKQVLNPDHPEYFGSQTEDEEVLGNKVEEQKRRNREAIMRITLSILRDLNQMELADHLQSKLYTSFCKRKLKSSLKKKFQCVFEGIPTAGNPTSLNQIYTELYITEGGVGKINEEHEVRQIEMAARKPHSAEATIRHEDIFKPPPGRQEPVRTVMTKGVAGIGKTVLTQKLTLDWAEDKNNHDIEFLFHFSFRELNVLKDKRFSLVELINQFFTETRRISHFEDFRVAFIFDGLDECRLSLDFSNHRILTDVTESASVDVLLTNLITGKLLPSAHLWITTRPAAASQIPPECVSMVTEVRGFTDPQKEEYFKKRFRDEGQASRVITHIRFSRSLHIMCHIPVFCWITATVLEDVLRTTEGEELPKTLTEMYIHFLVVQTKVKKVKFDGGAETDPHWSSESIEIITSLGRFAFEQLQKGKLIFYESDLTECGIDIKAASTYSGVFTQIFKEERGLYQERVFSFVHLSVQEFLAALHVHLNFINSGVNVMEEKQRKKKGLSSLKKQRPKGLHECAIDKALQSPNGHLDLFLRFLLGLSLQTNQNLLQGLLSQAGIINTPINQETVPYIKKKINENLSAEKSINLFHCLNELNDHSLVKEIQQSMSTGSLSTDKLTVAQWSALAFILLSSDQHLDVFDLKKYSASEEVLLRLLPVVKASSTALLNGCNLSKRSCEALSSVLSSQYCCLKELDLRDNNLWDSGVKHLSSGLRSPNCKLEVLSLSGCLITEEGCASLALALSCNPSHLKVLDLTYNHPGHSGVKLLSACQSSVLTTLRLEPAGEKWLIPGLKKYSHQLTFNTNSVSRHLKLYENNRRVMRVNEVQPYPQHPDRFDWSQLLCVEGLSGRCYWEVEWRGEVNISLSYKEIRRGEHNEDSLFGGNNQSWSLHCSSQDGYSVWHNKRKTCIVSSVSKIAAVYVDCPAGILSFYRVSSGSLIHLYTFNTEFQQKLYPGFGLWSVYSSVSLC